MVEAQCLMHQVLGALQIANKTERDSALAAACRECATAGDVESIWLGLPSITDKKRRDDVAEECVQMLAAANKQEVARKIVELITDPTTRAQLAAVLNAH